MAVYQKNVPWFQLISFSFYMISSLAGDEDNYLVKIMIMVREFLSGLVFKMKKSELFVRGILFFLSDRTVLIITYLPPIDICNDYLIESSKSPVEIVKRNKQWKVISGGKSLIHGIIISFNAQMYNYY